MSRKIRLLLIVAGGVAVVLVVVLLGLYLAARHEPAFYREAMAVDRGSLEEGSDRMLQQSAALASAVRKEGRWEFLFTADEINGWLAVDRVKNHPRALPPELVDPRVAIDSGGITLACRFERDGFQTVLSLTVEPYVPEPEVIALRIVKARAGLLPMPLEDVLDRIADAAHNAGFRLQWRRAGGDPVAVLSLPSDDDRPGRIEILRLGDGELYVAGDSSGKEP